MSEHGSGLQPDYNREANPSSPCGFTPLASGQKKSWPHLLLRHRQRHRVERVLRVKDDREAGREPPPPDEQRTTIKTLVNSFLTHKKSQCELGELTQTSFNDEFKRPKKSAFRRQRRSRLCEPADLRRIIDDADIQLRAMILLGINCGFGNADCGTLPIDAVDLEAGWIDFPRPRTGVERRSPSWPKTIDAINVWLSVRKPPRDEVDANLLFVTKYGQPWHRDGDYGSPLSAEFRKLLDRIDAEAIKAAKKSAKENGTKYVEPAKLRRPGLSFYSLRHCFQTIADELGDYIATRRIMGHADQSISDHYRERFQDERLRRVTDHVHEWLHPRPRVLVDGKDGAQ